MASIKEAEELNKKDNVDPWGNKPEMSEETEKIEGDETSLGSFTKRSSLASRNSFNKTSLQIPAEMGAYTSQRASFRTALPLLTHRIIINTRRQPQLILARTMQVIGLALVFALFFAPMQNDYYSVQNRMGFVQEIGAFCFVGMLQNMAVYPNERDVFYREDQDNVYSVEAFLASYTIVEVPFEIISCLIFGVLGVLAVGLPRTVTMYFVCVFSCFGIVSCGESLGIMFNTLFGHTGFAVSLMGLFLSIANVMAGVLSINMPTLFKAFNWISQIRYAVHGVALYSLRGIKFTCNDEQRLPDGSCPINTGEEILQLYSFDDDPVMNVAALAGCVVVYRVLAYALLKAMRMTWRENATERKVREWKGISHHHDTRLTPEHYDGYISALMR